MLRRTIATLLAGFLLCSVLPATPPAWAVGYCPKQKNGKCPTPKKISKSRSDFTPEQREKLMEDARKICREKYGASSMVYRMDYRKWTVICTPPGG